MEHALLHMLLIVLHREGGAVKDLARLGQKDLFAGLFKKRHAVGVFQIADVLGNGGLGKA